jgi:competence protein ComEC
MDSGVSLDSSTRLYDSYRRVVSKEAIRRLAIYSDDEITGFREVKLFVINPPEERASLDSNEGSTAIKLEYGNFSALFCADVSGKGIDNMLKYRDLLRSDLLKIPHHGGSSGKESIVNLFFEEVSPKVSIISSSAGFHSKDRSRADIYSRSALYNTKKNGAIEVFTDGKSFTVKPFCR